MFFYVFLVNGQPILNFQYGKYKSGFKHYYIEENETKYPIEINGIDTLWDKKPLVVAVWYPAKSNTDSIYEYSNFVQFKNYPIQLNQFIQRLRQFNIDAIKDYSYQKPTKNQDSLQLNLDFKALMSSKVKANFNASFIKNKKFPVLIQSIIHR